MSAFLSWVLMLTLAVSALWLASRFSAWLDRFIDRFMSADLDGVRRRDRALDVMASWHPSQGPQAHIVSPGHAARAECSCSRIPLREYEQMPAFGHVIPDPNCPVHSEES
jgi:hypothetical protein